MLVESGPRASREYGSGTGGVEGEGGRRRGEDGAGGGEGGRGRRVFLMSRCICGRVEFFRLEYIYWEVRGPSANSIDAARRGTRSAYRPVVCGEPAGGRIGGCTRVDGPTATQCLACSKVPRLRTPTARSRAAWWSLRIAAETRCMAPWNTRRPRCRSMQLRGGGLFSTLTTKAAEEQTQVTA